MKGEGEWRGGLEGGRASNEEEVRMKRIGALWFVSC